MSTNRSWFDIQNAATGATDVFVYNEIGVFGITAAAFVDAINGIKTKTINLYVNSPGGAVDDGMAIYNAIERHPATFNATVDGLAASIASVFIQAADNIAMGKGSVMMVHEPHGLAIGDAAVMTKMASELDLYGQNIAGIYAEKAGGTPEEWRSKMADETWFSADEAIAVGLAQGLASTTKGAQNLTGRIFNLAKFQNVPDWVESAPEDDADPPKSPLTGLQIDHKSPYLSHHDLTGAVDSDRLAVVLARAHNLNIPVPDREEAIRHLQGHATERGAKAA